MLVLSRFVVVLLTNALRLDSKTKSESTNRTDIGNPPRWCRAYDTFSESLGGVAYLVGNEKSFCRGQIEDDQCLVK